MSMVTAIAIMVTVIAIWVSFSVGLVWGFKIGQEAEHPEDQPKPYGGRA